MPDGKRNWWDEFLWNIMFRGTEPWRPFAQARGVPTLRTEALMALPEFQEAEQRRQLGGVPLGPSKDIKPEVPDWVAQLEKLLKEYAVEQARLQNELLRRQLAEPTAGARELATAQAQAEALRWQQMLRPPAGREQPAEDERAAMFEQVRQMWLERLTEPADWIKRWMAEHEPNPFVSRRPPLSELEKAQEALRRAQQEKESWISRALSLPKPMFPPPEEGMDLAQQLAQIAPEAIRSATDRIARLEREIQAGGLEGPEPEAERPPVQLLPPTPPWLESLGFGLTAGQPITRVPQLTPSAQQWARLPWSQRQGLRGFSEWSGQSWEDMLSRMEQMLPEQPFFGSTRWTPSRQRR